MKNPDKLENNSHVYRIIKRNKIRGKCSRCPLHDIENYGRRPKEDKYKNHR